LVCSSLYPSITSQTLQTPDAGPWQAASPRVRAFAEHCAAAPDLHFPPLLAQLVAAKRALLRAREQAVPDPDAPATPAPGPAAVWTLGDSVWTRHGHLAEAHVAVHLCSRGYLPDHAPGSAFQQVLAGLTNVRVTSRLVHRSIPLT
jgi:hypothetical protein